MKYERTCIWLVLAFLLSSVPAFANIKPRSPRSTRGKLARVALYTHVPVKPVADAPVVPKKLAGAAAAPDGKPIELGGRIITPAKPDAAKN
jgi:hypothetical protein